MLLNNKISIAFFIRNIRREAFFVFLFANLIVVIKLVFNLWFLIIPIAIPVLLGTCIALLLAFRTNQSYERWWEARIAWGAITNDSRSFIRQLQMFVSGEPDREAVIQTFIQRHCAWCYALGDRLRGQDATTRLEEFLSVDDARRISKAANIPNALLLDHGLAARNLYDNAQLTDYQMVQLSITMNNLTDSMGRCERIKNTVFPRTYTFNMQVFIYLFTALLPFCFEADLYFLDVPLVTLISCAFILIEKSAIQLQDPFENQPTDTPVTTIARTIEIDLKNMAAYAVIPEKLVPQAYYSC
ncbi:bestrophin family ion channel [Larkinella harenae]